MGSENENTNQRSKSRRRRSRGGRGRSKRNKVEKPIFPEHYSLPTLPTGQSEEPCPVCGDMVKDLHEAITDAETGKPAHFDCVHGRIAAGQELSEGEQLCYLGSGSFGIVGYVRREGKKVLEVRKRIEYEQKDSTVTWRKDFSPGLAKEWPDDEQAARIEDYEEEMRQQPNGDTLQMRDSQGNVEEMQALKHLDEDECS